MRRSRYFRPIGDLLMIHDPRQMHLFTLCAACGAQSVEHTGRLAVTLCPDGRRLVRLESGRRDTPWLELQPDAARWLAEKLLAEPGALDSEPGSAPGEKSL